MSEYYDEDLYDEDEPDPIEAAYNENQAAADAYALQYGFETRAAQIEQQIEAARQENIARSMEANAELALRSVRREVGPARFDALGRERLAEWINNNPSAITGETAQDLADQAHRAFLVAEAESKQLDDKAAWEKVKSSVVSSPWVGGGSR